MNHRYRTVAVALASSFAMAACSGSADLATRCLDLASSMVPGVDVRSAATVTDRDDLPAFCQVQGTINPNIGFEARFPLDAWNGKYYQSGCGGYCGGVYPDKPGFSNTINEALTRGYAAITTDNGHSGGPGDASWAKGNSEAVEVYAHKGIKLTHDAGSRLVETFYGTYPDRKYFGGCSNGGRMAAMAAQRYPTLFDGILGGGAVLNLSFSGGVYGSWVVQANAGEQGNRILDWDNFAAKIPALQRHVLGQCDASDGVKDGVISAPRNCAVDVNALPACDGKVSVDCFTDVEKGVLDRWYQGPTNSAGKQLYPGMPPGSEPFIGLWFLDKDGRVAVGNQLGGRYAKYLGFPDGTPDDYTALDFDFDVDPPRLAETGKLLDALDPDLTHFRDNGGKYLMWHGWADPLVLPDQTLDYYLSVADYMGGVDAIKPFFRLYMIPGQGHCWELPADVPDRFDPISVLDEWVESGRPPSGIPARALDPENATIVEALLCAHPATAIHLQPGEEGSCPES